MAGTDVVKIRSAFMVPLLSKKAADAAMNAGEKYQTGFRTKKNPKA
jgi:hypothetical protein